MKLNKSFEQAVYVLTMLALQENHTPVKSRVLSDILEVSDSYLKKILVKLTRAGLIQSNASKVGGYQLAQSVTTITLKDVFLLLIYKLMLSNSNIWLITSMMIQVTSSKLKIRFNKHWKKDFLHSITSWIH